MDRLSAAAWVSACFMAAVLFSNTVALRLILLLACLLLALSALFRKDAALRALPPLWLAFGLWAGWAWLSLAWSVEPERSLKELRNEIFYTGAAFWACYVSAQARESARAVLPVFAAGLALLCAVALYQFPQDMVRMGERWHGGGGNLSTIVLTVFPAVLVAAWYAQRAGRRGGAALGLALAALLLAAAYTTLNRTVWYGIAFEVLLVGALIAWREGVLFARRGGLVAAALALAVLGGVVLVSAHIHAGRVQEGKAFPLAADPRLQLWPEVAASIQARPLTGYGFGRGMLRQTLQDEFGDPLLWHSHNLFLDTAVQVGIPGLVLLLVLLAATLREGWRLARSPQRLASACGIAVIGVVAGMLIRNMTDVLWVRHSALLYWALLGVLFAWGRRAHAER